MASTATQTARTATLVAVLALAVLAEPASATTTSGHLPLALSWDDVNPARWIGEGFGKVRDVVLGPLKLGAKEIAQLIGTIVLAILDMLIPDWVVTAGPKVIAWIVEVENWGKHGGDVYRSINGLQGTLKWIGIALMTTGGTWSGLRVLAGHEAIEDVIRGWGIALFGVLLFGWGWGQATALTNSMTELILTQPGVSKGLTGFVSVIGGTALAASGGLVLPLLMIVAATVFVGLLAAKTMLLIVGALVYVTGQFAFALRVWPAGAAILRAWWSLAAAVFAIPIAWTLIFAVGGVMIVDALRVGAGGVIEMNAGKVFQSWMLAIAAIMTIVAAIKAAQAIFAMAKMAPLALISTMAGGSAVISSGGGASSSSKPGMGAGGRNAGQAANALMSNSERSMDAAGAGENLGPIPTSKQDLTVKGVQAAATYFAGPAAGAAAGTIAQKVTDQTSGNNEESTADGAPGTEPGASDTPTDDAPMDAVTATTQSAEATAAGTATESEPADPPTPPATEPDGPPNAKATTSSTGPDPEPAEPAPAPESAPSAPAPMPSDPPAAGLPPSPPPETSTSAPAPAPAPAAGPAPAGAATAAASVAAPSAPAGADRSIAGLPTGDAQTAFGIPNQTPRRITGGNGNGRTPEQPDPSTPTPEPRPDEGGELL